jgi:hypothetical protein
VADTLCRAEVVLSSELCQLEIAAVCNVPVQILVVQNFEATQFRGAAPCDVSKESS